MKYTRVVQKIETNILKTIRPDSYLLGSFVDLFPFSCTTGREFEVKRKTFSEWLPSGQQKQ
jgi:hypothetical protein